MILKTNLPFITAYIIYKSDLNLSMLKQNKGCSKLNPSLSYFDITVQRKLLLHSSECFFICQFPDNITCEV
jgi:hypothetical protein